MSSQWQTLVMTVVERTYEPGKRFSLQGLYQRVKGSPEYNQRPEIKDPEATIRNAVNALVRSGNLERLGQGDYRY